MGKFFIAGETVRVDFPDGEFVDLKEELTQADQDYIVNRMVGAKVRSDKGLSDVSLDLGKLSLMERMITGWSFKEDGKPVPVTMENISNLKARYRIPILEKIDQIQSAAGEWSKNSVTVST
jgi:hypothetical protein